MATQNQFYGIDRATLQKWLSEALEAQHAIMTGAKGESYSYTQGDGGKSVTYSRVNVADLAAYISQLKLTLGLTRSRPIRPYF